MSMHEAALVRDPYYTSMVSVLGEDRLVEAGFIPTLPRAPFPVGVFWPSLSFEAIADALKKDRKERPVVLLTTGSFAPVHEGHLAMMDAARQALEEQGRWVVGGVFSPSHDRYVLQKGDGQESYPDWRRIGLIQEAIRESSWLCVDDWECVGVRVAVNFTDVIARLEAVLARLFKRAFDVVYVFGGDNAAFMETFAVMGQGVCVVRPGYESPVYGEWVDPARHFVVESPLAWDVSSTQRRRGGVESLVSSGGVYCLRNDWPMIAQHWGVDADEVDVASTISQTLEVGLSPAWDIVRVEVEDQREWAKAQLEEDVRPVVSLDMFFCPSYRLDVSRRFALGGEQHHALSLGVRPEACETLLEQAQKVPQGDVVLVDDDSVSGTTVRFVQTLLGPSRPIARTVFLADAIDVCADDVVDLRDFIVGAPFGGLVVGSPDGQTVRVPYMAPYVNLVTRASMEPSAAIAVSIALWRFNADFLAQMDKAGAVLAQDDGLDRFAGLSGFCIDWECPFQTLSQLAAWHADVLEGVVV